MKVVMKDMHGRKAGKLGFLYICPHCGETLTRNKHIDELLLTMIVVFLPGFIAWISFNTKSKAGFIVALAIAIVSSIYALYHYRYKLRDHYRWVQYTKFIEGDN